MADEGKEISVEGDNMKSENNVSMGDNTSIGPIRRKRNRNSKIECKLCYKTMRSDNLQQHMKRKDHIQHGLSVITNKLSKKGRMICYICKDEIQTNIVDVRIVLGRAQTNAAHAKRNVSETCTMFEDARDDLLDAESTFMVAQANVTSQRKNFTDIYSIFKDTQKVISQRKKFTDIHSIFKNTQKLLSDAESTFAVTQTNVISRRK